MSTINSDGVKITEKTTVASVSGTDKVIINQGDTVKQATIDTVVNGSSLNIKVGLLESLTTGIKTSIVDAINWVVTKIGSTDISTIGNGTITSAISTINQNELQLSNNVSWAEWVDVKQTLADGTEQVYARYSKNAYETEIEFLNPITNFALTTWQGRLLFILPLAYRPSRQIVYSGMAYNNNVSYVNCSITVKMNGEVTLNNGTAIQATDVLIPLNPVFRFKR